MASRLISEDRRKYTRETFPEASQPILQVGPQAFAVVDISASGLRLRKDDGTQLGGWISGRILFGDREPIKIDGIVVRNQDGDLGLHFAAPMAFPVTK
jgi:hypothetical protein